MTINNKTIPEHIIEKCFYTLILDYDLKIKFISPELSKFHQLDSEHEILNQSFNKLYKDSDLEKALRNKDSWNGLVNIDLNNRHETVYLSAIHLEEEQSFFILHQNKENKNFEPHPEKYIDAIESSDLGLWEWDLQTGKFYTDQNYRNILGRNKECSESVSDFWLKYVHPDDICHFRTSINDYLNGKSDVNHVIHRMEHSNGKWLNLISKGNISKRDTKGNPLTFTGTIQDISQLVFSQNKVQFLYENSPFGFAFCDLDGNFIEINKEFSRITGYTKDELLDISYWHLTPAIYEKQEALQLESMKRTGKYGPYVKQYIHKDGHKIDVELNGFIIEDYNGVKGIWSVVEDITSKVNAQKSLEEQKKMSFHTAKLATIGQLASGVGHEINNPLSIVMGYLEVLRRDIENDQFDSQKTLKNIDKMEEASERILRIIKGLKTFSKVNEDTLSVFSFKELVETTLSIMKDLYRKEHIQLETFYESDFFIEGNKGRIQQAILNLLTNAKDSMHGLSHKKINVRMTKENSAICLSVKDTGTGIPYEIQNKVFEPFFTTKENFDGTGIGLSMAESIISEHGGMIQVISDPGYGSTFTIKLPDIEFEEDIEIPIPEGKDKKLEVSPYTLVVDDESEIRTILKSNLESLGLVVDTAKDGQEALEMARVNNYELIISDIRMPNMDGSDLLKALLKEGLKTKFIFVTGGVNPDFQKKEKEIIKKIDGYFYKPFTLSTIIKSIHTAFKY